MKILLVEDNDTIIKGLKYTLENNGYSFYSALLISDAINLLNSNKFDLVLLDITLPDGNGFDLYNDYIKSSNIPTIFLSAQDEEETIIKGLDIGADDYITKPFSTNILLAKIKKSLEKNSNNKIININNISFDLESMELKKDNVKIELSSLELKIINLLFNNLNKVVSRDKLLESIWEWTGNDVDDHTITVYMKRIKDKVGMDIIKTIKGIGYRIDGE